MSFANKEPRAPTRMSSRHRPLHTCGVSILAIVHIAYTKAQEFNGLIGSTARRVAKLAPFTGPLAYAMQYQWLAILSFADDQILAVENMIEKFFPPSNHVFNKIDYLVQVAETLPEKFDYAYDKIPTIVHQFRFDCALVQVIFLLNFFITKLSHWENGSAREKEIIVDINCEKQNNEQAFVDEAQKPEKFQANVDSEKKESLPPNSEIPQAETETVDKAVGVTKGTYKEVLEKGTKEEKKAGEEHIEKMEKNEKINVDKEEAEKGEEHNEDESNQSLLNDDPIIELFESAWLMNPGSGAKRYAESRSSSYA
ncbi:uncharacterized protein LOC115982261 [Quercus lobata]|uniref:uncharacterized protein LOC115982261 n=1 Tax=Quercus lobata TaxID=97700 RepID=UPI0012441378|nr:uncharacterized protein LOC115982261 [Quercus lobata]